MVFHQHLRRHAAGAGGVRACPGCSSTVTSPRKIGRQTAVGGFSIRTRPASVAGPWGPTTRRLRYRRGYFPELIEDLFIQAKGLAEGGRVLLGGDGARIRATSKPRCWHRRVRGRTGRRIRVRSARHRSKAIGTMLAGADRRLSAPPWLTPTANPSASTAALGRSS